MRFQSSSPISCSSSSSSGTSEDEDENQKLQHEQHRKELLELRRKLERTTDIENNNKDEGTDGINKKESKTKYASDKKCFENNIATKIEGIYSTEILEILACLNNSHL